MASVDEEFDDVALWPAPIEEYFVSLLYEEVKKEPQSSITIDKKAWMNIDDEIFVKFGKRYSIPKLKSKYNRLRKLYREFGKLLCHPGVNWDPKTNTVQATDDVWESYTKKNPFAKRFRKKGCDHYDILGEIFNSITTRQTGRSSSTLSPPNSDNERVLEAEFFGSSAHIELNNEEINPSLNEIIGDSKKTWCRSMNLPRDLRSRKGEGSKSSNLEEAIYIWTKTLSAKVEASSARVESSCSIEECMDLLESMENVEDVSYVKACERFTDPDWRRMFTKMSDGRRKMWLASLK